MEFEQRILSRHGHLSNDGAADTAQEIMSSDLRQLYLGHLSRQCNRPELAYQVMNERLERIGATHVSLQMTSQNILLRNIEPLMHRVQRIVSFELPGLQPYRTMRRQDDHRQQRIFVAEGEKVVRRLLESDFEAFHPTPKNGW